MEKEVEGVNKEPVLRDLPIVNPTIKPCAPPVPFPGRLKEHKDEEQDFLILESLKEKTIKEEDAVKLN
ncbi:hypothetical protein Tco_0325285, partial [Tanacetum coccineum]